MKMRNLLFGVILGLFAVVHSTPVNNVIQSPAKTEDDFLREALTEEFLIDYTSLPSLTTESTKRNTTVQASQQPSSDSKESDMIDDSATGATLISDESATSVFPQQGGEHYATTTPSVSHAQSSTSTVLPRDTDDSSSDSSTTRSPQSNFTSSPVPHEGQPNVIPDHISVSETTTRLETSDESTTSVFLQQGGEHYATTTVSVSHAQSSTSTVLPRDTDDSSSDSSTTQSLQSSFTSSPVPHEGQPNIIPDHISVSQTTTRLETSDESTTSVFLQQGGEHYATTTVSVSHAQSSTSTVLPRDTDDSSSDSSTTQSLQSSFTSSPVPHEGQPNVTPDHISVSQTTDPAVSTFINLSSDLGSEHEEMLGSATSSSMTSNSNIQTSTASSTSMADPIRESEGSGSEPGSGMENTAEEATNRNRLFQQHNTYTYSSNTQTSTASSTSMTVLIEESEGSGLGSEIESELISNTAETQNSMFQPPNKGSLKEAEIINIASPQNKGHSTPSWIIIVGFIVGVAALVMLCVAIATRDKWNGPNQASQLETKTNSSNQQRELEMETFLHKDSPRENGKAAEYTVIPLDELPEKYSSH